MAKINLSLNHDLELKQLSLEDAANIAAVTNTKDNYFLNWIDQSIKIKNADDAKNFLMKELVRLEQQREFLFSISDKVGFIGIVGFYSTDKVNNKTDLIIWMARRGRTVQNYSDILDGILSYGFMELGFNRIQAKTLAADFSYNGALRKAGFINEGIERAGLLTSEKTYANISILSIIKNEFIAHSKYQIRSEKLFQRKNK